VAAAADAIVAEVQGRISRRALLVGAGGSLTAAAGGSALVDTGVLPGELRLHRALGACDVGGPLPRVAPDDRIGFPWILADRVRAGAPPMVLVGADGGTGYWHPRANGDDAGRMLFDELLPLLHRRGFPTARIDAFARAGRLAGMPVRIDCGRDDSFAGASRAFLADAPSTVTGAITAGCHDAAFWRSAAYHHVGTIARHLA
jgi:hypothetical protein